MTTDDFLTGDDRFEIESARIDFHRETDRDLWLMNLEILTPSPPDPDEDSPRLELRRGPAVPSMRNRRLVEPFSLSLRPQSSRPG